MLYVQDAMSLNLFLETVCPSFLMYFTSLSNTEIVLSDRTQQLSGYCALIILQVIIIHLRRFHLSDDD